MTNAVLEKEKKVAPPSIEKRLEDYFPCRDDEFRRDIRPLWKNHYRINFWTQIGKGIVPDNRVARSYFVIVSDNKIYISPDKGEKIEITEPVP